MAELADALDLKSSSSNRVRVQFPLPAHTPPRIFFRIIMTTLLDKLLPEELITLRGDFYPNKAAMATALEFFQKLFLSDLSTPFLEQVCQLRSKGVFYYYFDRDKKYLFLGIEEDSYSSEWTRGESPFKPREVLPVLIGHRGTEFSDQELNSKIKSYLVKEEKYIALQPRIIRFCDPKNTMIEGINMVLVGFDCSSIHNITL